MDDGEITNKLIVDELLGVVGDLQFIKDSLLHPGMPDDDEDEWEYFRTRQDELNKHGRELALLFPGAIPFKLRMAFTSSVVEVKEGLRKQPRRSGQQQPLQERRRKG